MNEQDRLTEMLDNILDRFDRSKNGVTPALWFQLAVVAIHCLISIASAMWDKE